MKAQCNKSHWKIVSVTKMDCPFHKSLIIWPIQFAEAMNVAANIEYMIISSTVPIKFLLPICKEMEWIKRIPGEVPHYTVNKWS